MPSKNWLLFGISGATCSGKTSLVIEIQKHLKDCVVIHQDHYFLPENDPRHTKIPELNHMNWEILTAVDMERMQRDIMKLIESPPEDKDHQAEPNKKRILLLDGFILFKSKFIRDICHQKYFLTLPKEQCCERRKGRSYDPPDVPGYFDKVVWPEYVKYLSELMNFKDLCEPITFIDGSKSKEEIFKMVFAEIKKMLC